MRTIREVAGTELVWVATGKAEAFELRSGDEVVGTLQWKGSSLAIGETGDQQWTLKREGIWHPRVTVRVLGSDANVALFHPGWMSGGTLDLGAGRQLRLGPSSFWSGWVWTDELKRPLIRFRSKGFLKWDCGVEIEKEAESSPDAPLLVVLGWYLIVMHTYDSQAGAGG